MSKFDPDEEYTPTNNPGCILCPHGRFIRGPFPQKVNCAKLGEITERTNCEHWTHPGPIQSIDLGKYPQTNN